MTIPWMMNCGHSEDSWCLDCVMKLGEERQRLRDLLRAVLDGPTPANWGELARAALQGAADQPALSQRLNAAGYSERDNRLACDECGKLFTAQMLPIHKCAADKS